MLWRTKHYSCALNWTKPKTTHHVQDKSLSILQKARIAFQQWKTEFHQELFKWIENLYQEKIITRPQLLSKILEIQC